MEQQQNKKISGIFFFRPIRPALIESENDEKFRFGTSYIKVQFVDLPNFRVEKSLKYLALSAVWSSQTV